MDEQHGAWYVGDIASQQSVKEYLGYKLSEIDARFALVGTYTHVERMQMEGERAALFRAWRDLLGTDYRP